MRWHKRTLVITLSLLLIAVLILYLVKELAVALQVSNSTTEIASEPAAFVLAYDTTVNHPKELFAYGTTHFWPPSGWEAYSPLIPYKTLKETWVQTEPCRIDPDGSGGEIVSGEDRAILTDPVWELSWVYVAKCHQEEPLHFGPYRFTEAF